WRFPLTIAHLILDPPRPAEYLFFRLLRRVYPRSVSIGEFRTVSNGKRQGSGALCPIEPKRCALSRGTTFGSKNWRPLARPSGHSRPVGTLVILVQKGAFFETGLRDYGISGCALRRSAISA